MSEESEATKRKPKPISEELQSKVIDHINELSTKTDDECLVCGSPNNEVLPTVQAVEVIEQPFTISAYSTVCNNCGFMRFFARNIVDKATGEDS